MGDWAIHEGDYRDVLPSLGPVDVAIFDPPYSAKTHEGVKNGRSARLKDGASRNQDLGFDHLKAEDRRFLADWCAAHVRRWVAVFSDAEGQEDWASDLGVGLQVVRRGIWVRRGCTPQMTGDRPGPGHECITIAHRKGRKRWNGGGRAAVWDYPIVSANSKEGRYHTTPKPIGLMLELVELFSDPGETVIDFTCGSGTTGVACLRLGRNFIGIERMPEHAETARQRLEAEAQGISLAAHRAGQVPMFKE